MHDPLPSIGRQVDLIVSCHLLQEPLEVRLLHEPEAYFDSDDAAALMIPIEYGYSIAIIPHVGHFAMGYFDKDQVSRQDAMPLP